MSTKKLNDIKKGLELCLDPNAEVCFDCPYFGKGCSYILKADAFALIKTLEQRIKFLKAKIKGNPL